jgi:hypothetical protein
MSLEKDEKYGKYTMGPQQSGVGCYECNSKTHGIRVCKQYLGRKKRGLDDKKQLKKLQARVSELEAIQATQQL